MLENQAFTDPQGQNYTAAVVEIGRAYRTTNEQSDSLSEVRLASTFTDPRIETSTSNESLRDEVVVKYVYWPTQQAYDAGFQYYSLYNIAKLSTNQFDEFIISKEELKKSKYVNLSLAEICLLYFTDEILPTLQ